MVEINGIETLGSIGAKNKILTKKVCDFSDPFLQIFIFFDYERSCQSN